MRFFFLFVLMLAVSLAEAQQISKKEYTNRAFLKEILNNPAEDVPSEYYEIMLQNLEHPLELNTVNQNQLFSLLLLSDVQIAAFLEYRKMGTFLSVNELQVIPHFDQAIINKLLPFVYVKEEGLNAKSLQSSIKATDHLLLLRYAQTLETKKGFDPASKSTAKYLGDPMGWYLRYKMYAPKSISMGFSIEKDPGETQLHDFTSFHVSIENKGKWKNIILGDYQLQFGQGIVSSAGFFIGKSSESILPVKRNHIGARAYTSVVEQNFFRGATATYKLGKFDITGFYSNTYKDANQIKDSTGKTTKISSLSTTGLHRNTSEIEDKNSLNEINTGGDFTYRSNKNNFQLGFTSLYTKFDIPYIRAEKQYNKYEFSGTSNLLLSLHYSYLWKNYHFFGETARSSSGGIGLINGVLASFGKNTDMALLFRNYDKNFHSLSGNSFSENSRNINEKGIYWGLKHVLHNKWTLSAYFDYFQFPWFRYLQTIKNTDGIGYMARLSYKPNKKFNAYFQYRQENKDENAKIVESYFDSKGKPKTRNITVIRNRVRSIFNFYSDYDITPNINLQSRVSYNIIKFHQQAFTQGFGIAQDINIDYKKWSIAGRLAFYNTDEFDNSVYFYEQDVLYAFSFPGYYKHGLRQYLLVHYKANKTFDFWIKIARSSLFDEKGIFGSGNDEIPLPRRTDLKIQARIQF